MTRGRFRSSLTVVIELLRPLFSKKSDTRGWKAEHEFAYYGLERKLYDEHLAHQAAYRAEAHFTGQRLMRNVGLVRREMAFGKDVLDVGAGEACLSQALATAFSPRVVWAVDALPKQIFAPALCGEQERLRYLVASALDLPFPDESFDIVVAHLFVHHIPEKQALFREIYRVLRKGGEFRCFEPNLVVEMLLERGHSHGSENEQGLFPWQLVREIKDVFGNAEMTYHWSRLESARLGVLSPSFRVVARREGAPSSEREMEPVPSRELISTGIGSLLMDPTIPFKGLAEEQLKKLRELAP